MVNLKRIQWRSVPWLTLTLFGVIWSIHLTTQQFGIQSEVRSTYGLSSGSVLTYLTHAFLHANLFHIISNSVSLLIFGSVVESQISRLRFAAIVLLGIFAGGTFAMWFPHPPEPYSGEAPVGLSAATLALRIVGISVLAYYWRWRKAVLILTLFISGPLLLTFTYEAFTDASVSGAAAALALLVVGLGAVQSYRFNTLKLSSALLSILWVFLPLYELMDANTWSYGAAAHLAGAIAGAIVMIPVLRGGITAPRTIWLKGRVTRAWDGWFVKPANKIRAGVNSGQLRQNRALSAATFTSILVIVSIIAYLKGHGIYSFYYDFYFN